jgi:hypothetical protein
VRHPTVRPDPSRLAEKSPRRIHVDGMQRRTVEAPEPGRAARCLRQPRRTVSIEGTPAVERDILRASAPASASSAGWRHERPAIVRDAIEQRGYQTASPRRSRLLLAQQVSSRTHAPIPSHAYRAADWPHARQTRPSGVIWARLSKRTPGAPDAGDSGVGSTSTCATRARPHGRNPVTIHGTCTVSAATAYGRCACPRPAPPMVGGDDHQRRPRPDPRARRRIPSCR